MKKHLKNNKSKLKYIFRISIISALLLIVFLGVIYAVSNFSTKGELNDDGEINYADVSLLQLHLIHLKELPEDKLENADINSDGEITITDLNLLIKKIEKTLEYEATVRNIEANNYYPNKNEEITLNLDMDVSYNIEIKTITIDGKEYEIVRNEQNQNLYEVKLNVGDTQGVKEYKIEKITLINEQEIKLNKSVKVDVLKSQPRIENWTLTEDLEKSELNISFDIVDSDGAVNTEIASETIMNGEYVIIEKNEETENSEETNYIQQGAVKLGTNNINVKVEENKKYQILVEVPYNLDTGTLEQEGDNSGRLKKDEELALIKDYHFQLSNIKTYKEDKEDTISEEFNVDEHIIVKFESTNVTEYLLQSAIINGKKYELTKEEDSNIYSTFIDGFDSAGNNNIKIEKVTLGNGKEFEVNQDKQVKIIKNTPTVARFRSHENTAEKNMDMLIFIKDKDKTITNLTVKLVDENNNEITSKDLTEYLKDENLNDSEEEDIKNTYYINTRLYSRRIF